MGSASRRGLLVAVLAAVLATAYSWSFVFAQATPEPHELPIAVAGPSERVAELARRVQTAAGESYDVRRLDGAGAARQALQRGDVYVAAVVGDGPARLLTAAALGRGAVMSTVTELPGLLGLPAMPPPQVEEVRPLAEEDQEGTALNLQLFPLLILGIVVPIMMLLIAPGLQVRSRLAAIALFSLLGGLGAMLMANVALDALPGSFPALVGFAILLAFAVAATTTAFIAIVGPPGVVLGLVLFLIVGNVASGAAVVHELLPGFYREVGPYLPPGAAADALRSVSYFEGADLLRPTLVLVAFAVVGAAIDLLLGGRRPAPQGDPAGPTPDQTVTT